MAKVRVSEQRARAVTRELLTFRSWDVGSVYRGGQLLEEAEYKNYKSLDRIFVGKSKKGSGDGRPDFLLVNSAAGLRPVLVVETKASSHQIQDAIDEATHYGDACFIAGHDVIAVGVAGDAREVCAVAVKRRVGRHWLPLTLHGKPIDWIPSPVQINALFAEMGRLDVEPERPSDEVLNQQANRLNELFRECKIKDEFRPIYAATFMLALWQGDVSTDESVVLSQINANARQALEKATKPQLAQSLRVDDQNNALASRAWEVIDILKKLNIRSFLQEHDYLGQLYETFFRYTAGNTIGQYFTPRHIIAFLVNLLEVQSTDTVFDPACGTGGFLIGALNAMIRKTGLTYEEAVERVRLNLFGIESEPATAALCVTNMILRGDGKSGVIKDDCFKNTTFPGKEVDFILMNPPFPHKKTDTPATEFIDRGLQSLKRRGKLAAIVPYSLLVSAGAWHKALLKKNNVQLVATLPADLFNPYASYNTAILVIEKGVPQGDSPTFVCRIANDGFKLKKNARIWQGNAGDMDRISDAYRSRVAIPELSALARLDEGSPEWSPEAFIKNAPHKDQPFLEGLENHVRKHAAFYLLYGHRLIAKEALRAAQEQLSSQIFSAETEINLEGVKYGSLRLCDHFDIQLGGKEEIEDLDEGGVPIVSTSEFSNGVTAFRQSKSTYPKDVITVATDGSTCSSFVQEFEFYAFYKVAILQRINARLVPLDAMYYIAYLLFRERWRYVYARKFGKARLKITELVVPVRCDGAPDFDLMAQMVRQCKAFPTIELFRKAMARP
jgi:predicted RNA methylase